MKDASDLRAKAKGARAKRRENSHKDADRMNFKDDKSYQRHEMSEMGEEHEIKMATWRLGKQRN